LKKISKWWSFVIWRGHRHEIDQHSFAIPKELKAVSFNMSG
jgi:hypothetical protein